MNVTLLCIVHVTKYCLCVCDVVEIHRDVLSIIYDGLAQGMRESSATAPRSPVSYVSYLLIEIAVSLCGEVSFVCI